MALIFQCLAFTLDMKFKTNGTVFMFSLPFSVFLISGKQWYDNKKDIAEIKKSVNQISDAKG